MKPHERDAITPPASEGSSSRMARRLKSVPAQFGIRPRRLHVRIDRHHLTESP